MKMSLIKSIQSQKIIAIMRGVQPDDVLAIFRALTKGGIKSFEVTLDSPRAYEMIQTLAKEKGDDISIGAGTVLDPASARKAIEYGADFIVSPTLHLETIQMTKKHGAISIPGCLTPTEILTAYENGEDMVKVFPASSLGANYFKDLSGPLPHIPLIATGGIYKENIQSYVTSGVTAVGLGSSLVPKKITDQTELTQLTKEASKLVHLMADH